MIISLNSGYRFATVDHIEKYECPHILEHQVFDGSKKYPSLDELQDVFQEAGGNINGITDAYANFFPIHTRVTNAKKVIDAALDMVYNPLLTEKSFNEELDVIRNELTDQLGDFQSESAKMTFQQILPGQPMSTDTMLDRLPYVTHEDVLKYHKKYYTTKNTSIVIATDLKKISRKDIEKTILSSSKGARAGKKFAFPTFDIEPSTQTSQFITINKSLTESIVSLQFAVKDEMTIKERVATQLFCAIATSMKSYGVTHKLRKMGLVYGLNLSGMESQETHGLELSIAAQNDKFVEVFAYAIGGIRELAKSGISEEQFKQIKQDTIHAIEDAVESPSDLLGWYHYDYFLNRDVRGFEDYASLIKKIKQSEMLKIIDEQFDYQNLYATVFSSKAIRASSAVDNLSKEILMNNQKVTADFIELHTTSLSSGDNRYKYIVGASITALASLVVLPLFGLFGDNSISHLILDPVYTAVVYLLVLGLLYMFIWVHSGALLRSSVAWTSAVLSGLALLFILFEFDAAVQIFTSPNTLLALHAYLVLGLLVLIPLGTVLVYYKTRPTDRKEDRAEVDREISEKVDKAVEKYDGFFNPKKKSTWELMVDYAKWRHLELFGWAFALMLLDHVLRWSFMDIDLAIILFAILALLATIFRNKLPYSTFVPLIAPLSYISFIIGSYLFLDNFSNTFWSWALAFGAISSLGENITFDSRAIYKKFKKSKTKIAVKKI